MQMSLIGVMILPNMFRLTDQTFEELFLYLQVSISHRMKLKEWFIITFFSLRSECFNFPVILQILSNAIAKIKKSKNWRIQNIYINKDIILTKFLRCSTSDTLSYLWYWCYLWNVSQCGTSSKRKQAVRKRNILYHL